MVGIVSHNLMNLKAKQLEHYMKEEKKNALKIQKIILDNEAKADKKQLKKSTLQPELLTTPK